MRYSVFTIVLLALFALTGCTEARLAAHAVKQLPGMGASKSQGTFKVGNPYVIDGKRYTPRETYSFTETGIASWYGRDFHGKRTANGEIFDMNELTAAHRTLQLPSLVRVTNLENGRSLIVRVNDRGPFKRSRVMDVSRRAAELLGFKNQGTAKVKLQVLPQESMKIAEAAKRGEDTRGTEVAANEGRLSVKPPREPITTQQASYQPPAEVEVEQLGTSAPPGHLKEGKFLPDPVVEQMPVSPTNIFVQAGSFTDRTNAQNLAQSLQSYGRAQVYPATVNGQQFYRVRFGPMRDVAMADGVLSNLANAGHAQAIIVVE
ncbi:MAG: septal ring lytic transglycosylase RlpA family protein [Alphaproteobacteria bacterium]|nr:septal ring lytic transglycosylase RlpA family protein [Alphaproteobacteria bacterium]